MSISVVIPIHEFNQETDRPFLEKALESVKKNKQQPDNISVVLTKELSYYNIDDLIKTYNISVVKNDTENTDFQSQINLFAKQNQFDYFLILELDDELSENAISNYQTYLDAYGEKVDILLPLTVETDNQDNMLKYSNCEVFATAVYGEEKIGTLTNKMLQTNHSFITSGGLFKNDSFVAINGFKKSMNIAFIYEYLLRATNNDQNIIVVPKLGYLHRNNRVGSYLHSLNERGVTQEEVAFYYESSKKEFYFTKDRNIEYKA